MGLESVLATMRSTITTALTSAGISQKGQIINGWPTAPQLVEIVGQPDNEWQISLYPMPGTNETRWVGERGYVNPAPAAWPLTGTIASGAPNTLTFAGAAGSGSALNVHAFIYDVNEDVYVPVAAGTSSAQTAIALAAAVNGLGLASVSASASGSSTILSGANRWAYCNIGGSATVVGSEVLRTGRIVQVSIWTTGGLLNGNIDASLRLAMYDAVVAALGTSGAHFLTLADGSKAFVQFRGDSFDDDAQSSYSLYVAHIKYYVEYGIFSYFTATQVGDAVVTATTSGTAIPQSITDYIGGP